MPAKKEVKPVTAKAVASKSSVDYKKELAAQKSEVASLKKELDSLKKVVDSLKGQCHSCCEDIAVIKASKESAVSDSRLDDLLKRIRSSIDYKSLRRLYK